MREIEFRAKTLSEVSGLNRKKDGLWVYGFYRDKVGLPTISEFDVFVADYIDYEVDRQTLGQFTGLCDKNGKKIYEGDIVKILYTDWASKSDNDTRTLEEYLDSLTKTGIVFWDNLSLCYHLKMKNGCYNSIHCGRYGYIEVVGNIYDNGGSDEECDN